MLNNLQLKISKEILTLSRKLKVSNDEEKNNIFNVISLMKFAFELANDEDSVSRANQIFQNSKLIQSNKEKTDG